MIAIIDYGCGNLGSIKNMLKKIGVDSLITNKLEEIKEATQIILPGVGSFDTGMRNLKELDLISVLEEKAMNEKVPFLGICLGMQLMTKSSEEGKESGLGWMDAQTKRFPVSKELKVPNMGWNEIQLKQKHSLFEGIENPRFYFVHSYFIKSNDEKDILAMANYGIDYTCSFAKENIMGVQFHPEKSHRYGMQLLTNFSKLS